jgi:type VI protein secretion system component Hcp
MSLNNLLLTLTTGGDVVKGECEAYGQEGKIEVDSLKFDIGGAVDVTSDVQDIADTGSSADAFKAAKRLLAVRMNSKKSMRKSIVDVTFSPVTITKRFDNSSGAFLNALRSQAVFDEAIFVTLRRVTDASKVKTVPWLTIKLNHVTVLSIDLGTTADGALTYVKEDIVLEYKKIEVDFAPERPPSGNLHFDYAQEAN